MGGANDLVNLKEFDPTLVIDARYASADNIAGRAIYTGRELFLRKAVAERLVRVQRKLKEKDLGIKIWDAYRPHSVQKILWDKMPDERYVADPEFGSRHNRGCAVDITLIDGQGKELPMPTGFDEFTEHAHRNYPDLPEEVLKNRKILEDAMKSEGFIALPTEWWHFDDPAWEKFPILDINPWK